MLSYQVDALRTLMLVGVTSSDGLVLDFAVVLAATAVLAALPGRHYLKVIQ